MFGVLFFVLFGSWVLSCVFSDKTATATGVTQRVAELSLEDQMRRDALIFRVAYRMLVGFLLLTCGLLYAVSNPLWDTDGFKLLIALILAVVLPFIFKAVHWALALHIPPMHQDLDRFFDEHGKLIRFF